MIRMSIISALLVTAIVTSVSGYLQLSSLSLLSLLVYGQQQIENEFRQKEFVEIERELGEQKTYPPCYPISC